LNPDLCAAQPFSQRLQRANLESDSVNPLTAATVQPIVDHLLASTTRLSDLVNPPFAQHRGIGIVRGPKTETGANLAAMHLDQTAMPRAPAEYFPRIVNLDTKRGNHFHRDFVRPDRKSSLQLEKLRLDDETKPGRPRLVPHSSAINIAQRPQGLKLFFGPALSNLMPSSRPRPNLRPSTTTLE
jgi:hypothetical protein